MKALAQFFFVFMNLGVHNLFFKAWQISASKRNFLKFGESQRPKIFFKLGESRRPKEIF
jgi:hypothetical protein